MIANRETVDLWIKAAKSTKSEYIISIWDTFDMGDYPVFCKNKSVLIEKLKQYNDNNMERINEIIHIDGETVIEDLNIHNI